MRLDSAHLEHARRVADAILYEGYLLYPYRGSAQKNRARFQFGVLVPPAYRTVDDCERAASQTECLVECGDDAEVLVLVRFLQLQRRIVQAASAEGGEFRDVETLWVDDREYTSWDEAAERQQQLAVRVSALLGRDRNLEFHVGSGELTEDLTEAAGAPAGRLLRRWAALDGLIQLSAERVAGPYGALRLRVRVENRTEPEPRPRNRDEALRHSLIAAHTLIGVPGGKFLSLTDPPEWAAAEAAACVNTGTWPVLAGPEECQDLVLSSPVILYDHPEIAAESAGDLFDATEIDEILTLRTLALTDAEKREARATDPRAAELMDRMDNLPPEMLERMHGAIRYLKSVPGAAAGMPGRAAAMHGGAAGVPGAAAGMPGGAAGLPGWPPEPVGGAAGGTAGEPGDPFGDPILDRPPVPWWDPGADASVSPETDHVVVAGVRVARGSKVRMRPGSRRADAQDLFLVGRTALVEAVLHDVDGQVHVAVSPDHDPVADLQASHGRFLYFAPDEIEPLDPADSAGPAASTERRRARRARAGAVLSRALPAAPHPAPRGGNNAHEVDQGGLARRSAGSDRPVAARHQALPRAPRDVTGQDGCPSASRRGKAGRMETIVGFVAGYLVGAREGRDGLERLRSSWKAIRTSTEVRKLASEAMTVAEMAVRRGSGRGNISGAVGEVTDMIMRRAAGARSGSRAA